MSRQMSSVRAVVGQACILRYSANDSPPMGSVCCNTTNTMRRLCQLQDALPKHQVFNQQSNEADRLRHEAMIRAKMKQMKIAEAKRVAKLRKSIPKQLDESLKVRAGQGQKRLDEYNDYAKANNKLYEIQMMMAEETGQQEKADKKVALDNQNIKTVEMQSAKVAEEREAAFITPEIISSISSSASASSSLVEEAENPYLDVMTDQHAEIALARDELKEKRLKRQKLAETATEEVRNEQRASEKAFRKYLVQNRNKMRKGEETMRSPFLRSQHVGRK